MDRAVAVPLDHRRSRSSASLALFRASLRDIHFSVDRTRALAAVSPGPPPTLSPDDVTEVRRAFNYPFSIECCCV